MAEVAELEINAQRHHVVCRSALMIDRVHADPDLLRRTLTNLIENAILAPPETAIGVTSARVAAQTEVRIADAGTDPQEMREKVFDPFVQVEAGEPRVERAGQRSLGLTFCKLAICR